MFPNGNTWEHFGCNPNHVPIANTCMGNKESGMVTAEGMYRCRARETTTGRVTVCAHNYHIIIINFIQCNISTEGLSEKGSDSQKRNKIYYLSIQTYYMDIYNR